MKRLLCIAALLLSLTCTFTSCRDALNDAINDLYKHEYVNYLHNETEQDVTVLFGPAMGEDEGLTVRVPKGQSVEIPNAVRLGVSLRALERDSVVFVFADGSRMVHSYTNTSFGQDSYHFIYQPARNNIFYTGYDISSEDDAWVPTTLSTLKLRYDYTIRRP